MNWSRRLTTFVTFDPSIPTSNELPSPVNPAFCRPLLPHCSVRGRPASEGFPSTGITLQGPAQRRHTLCPVYVPTAPGSLQLHKHRAALTLSQETGDSKKPQPQPLKGVKQAVGYKSGSSCSLAPRHTPQSQEVSYSHLNHSPH